MAHVLSPLLEIIVEHIDIPQSLYERAAARHRSLGLWLNREQSTLRQYEPDVRPQGSFRFGLVTRPINEDNEYDLDNVCVLTKLTKGDLTQHQLKTLYGIEIKAYAKANGITAPVTEHNRCWRLQYADEVKFHLDTLPCVPEETAVILRLVQAGVPNELARRAIAITDKRHPQYDQLVALWLSSNPRGFATWFEQRTALARERVFAEKALRATVEDVPPYSWKTPLQRAIQLLKRHRDVMFRNAPELAPISMIITNLAARAYNGETNIGDALINIVDKMRTFISSVLPRVPNPADPAEDYADKWRLDARLEKSFLEWHFAVKTALAQLPTVQRGANLGREIQSLFDVTLTQQEVRSLRGSGTQGPHIITKSAPTLVIPSAPKPWGANG